MDKQVDCDALRSGAAVHHTEPMGTDKLRFIEEIYRKYWSPLHGFLKKQLLNDAEAADVAQDAYLRMAALDKPEELEQPRAFLYKTARNLLIDRARANATRTRHREAECSQHAQNPLLAPSVEEQAAANEALGVLGAAIESLPPRRRQVFVLHKLHHMSHVEITRELGISRHAVDKHLFRALGQIQKEFEEYFEE